MDNSGWGFLYVMFMIGLISTVILTLSIIGFGLWWLFTSIL